MTSQAALLEGLAELELTITQAVDRAQIAPASLADAGAASREIAAGTPLLLSSAAPDLEFVAETTDRITASLPLYQEGVDRLVAWHVLRRALAPVIASIDTDGWQRPQCPMCGAAASLAILTGDDGARRRRLACTFCHAVWNYKRTGCVSCGNEDPQSLESLRADDERDHRLDVCHQCLSYVKTYSGSHPEVFLSDWTTLYLDVLATERGFRRAGAALYDL